MADRVIGVRTMRMVRDQDGHRTYTVRRLVELDSSDKGPAAALQCPGIPLVGSVWRVEDDVDVWAWCRPDAQVSIHQEQEGDRAAIYSVEQVFSTRPLDSCRENRVEDPLLEPQKKSGGFDKYQEEGLFDRFGNVITNSAWELVRGPMNEWDANRPSVRISQNVPFLGIELFAPMIDTVNDSDLWGFPRRCVKLSNVTWEENYYGQCNVYYTRTFEFDFRYDTFDRVLPDEGTKVLNGKWAAGGEWELLTINGQAPNRFNPAHFMRAVDRQNNPIKIMLNGFGVPAEVTLGTTYYRVKTFSLRSSGQNYVPGEVIYIAGGTSTQPVALRVIKANSTTGGGGGQIITVELVQQGRYSVKPTPDTPVTHGTSTGHGTGAAFNVTWEEVHGIQTGIGTINIQKYRESNFLLLGIPARI